MNHPSRVSRPLIAVLVAALVGVVAYNIGFSHGVVQQLPAGAAGFYPWPYRPWGFGFLFPLLVVFFLVRVLFGGGSWRRGWYGHHGGCYPAGSPGVPPAFDEWHRRAHERDQQAPPSPTV